MSDSHFPRFSTEEYARRYAAIRAMLEREGAAALLIFGNGTLGRTGQADLHYISNFLGNRDNLGIFPLAGEPTLLVQSRNHAPDARRASVVADTRWGGPDSAAAAAAQLRALGLVAMTIGVVGPLPYQNYLTLSRELPEARFVDLTRQYRRLRVDKSDEEVAWMRRGAAFTDAAMRALQEQVRPGLKEYQLAAIVEGAYMHDGGQPHLHYISSTAMGASERCVPAQNLSERELRAGDVILTEISAAYWGYSGQILRPIAVAAEPPADYQDLYRVAEEAYHRVCAAIRPGATAQEVQDAGRFIDEAGYTICDTLVHGFGMGLLPPNIDTPATQDGPLPPFTFRKNMCLVVQPNVVTQDQRKGVQVGNLCVVTDTGLETLQTFPITFVRAG